MIELYCVEDGNIDNKIWWKQKSVEILERLFKLIFGNYIYNQETREYYCNDKFRCKKQNFDLNVNQRMIFLAIMSNLWSDCLDEKFYHFDLLGVESLTVNEFRNFPLAHGGKRTYFPNWKLAHKHMQLNMQGKMDLYNIRNKALSALIRQYKKEIGTLKVISIDYIKYNIATTTEFGQTLLKAEPKEDPITQIQDPLWLQNNLIRLVRAILVKFHIVFGDYSRIKVCKNCENLFFEKKKGARKCCSKKCSDVYSRMQDLDLRRCRDRQNEWIKRRLNSDKRLGDYDLPPSRICKAHCLECLTIEEGGSCWFLMKRNREVFELLGNTYMQ